MTILGSRPSDGINTGQPFLPGTGGSENFRIPCLVTLDDGTLVAAADVRWDTEMDGGGMDLIVSRSEDGGATWHYTFPAYLGDNGNVCNPDSTTIMDPALITDGKRLWLLGDLFPAGYSLTTACTTHAFSDPRTGFDEKGRLLLSRDGEHFDHILEDGSILAPDGSAIPGVTVDGSFDIFENGGYAGNLFFADAPFKVMPVSFIAMQTSDDGGKSWSGFRLLNLKDEGRSFLILGPGRGLTASDGTIMFSAYDGESVYLVYSKDGGKTWQKSSSPEADGENQLVELPGGNIRMFVRTPGTNRICYLDFAKTADGYLPGKIINTGVPNFSRCMISAIRLRRTRQETILVCCPSDSEGGMWAGRFNGKIHVFSLDEQNNMTLESAYQLNEGFFAYSNMSERADGSIDILYEDDCISYRAGNHFGKRSQIVYRHLEK